MAKKAYASGDGIARKVKKIYGGVDGVARKVKKAYVGIGGVARPCFGSGLEYYGMITPLSERRRCVGAATVGECALFAGGVSPGGEIYRGVDGFDNALTKLSSVPDLTESAVGTSVERFAATTVGNYALFAASAYNNKTADAYDGALTKSSPTILTHDDSEMSAASIGDYALIAGGWFGGSRTNLVNVVNSSLTKMSDSGIRYKVRRPTGVSGKNYAFFAGGNTSGTWDNTTSFLNYVTAFDSSLTCSFPPDLTDRKCPAGASIGNYVVFAGMAYGDGLYASNSTCDTTMVEVYDASLTKSLAAPLSANTHNVMGASTGDYALFIGCFYYTSSDDSPNGVLDAKYHIVNAYDSSLTQTILEDDAVAIQSAMQYGPNASAILKDYALFTGGDSNGRTDKVIAYKLL